MHLNLILVSQERGVNTSHRLQATLKNSAEKWRFKYHLRSNSSANKLNYDLFRLRCDATFYFFILFFYFLYWLCVCYFLLINFQHVCKMTKTFKLATKIRPSFLFIIGKFLVKYKITQAQQDRKRLVANVHLLSVEQFPSYISFSIIRS